jgi:toxin ParE1/3/4
LKVEWLDAALDDMERITDFVARDNRGAAARLERRIREATARLGDQPGLGRPGRVGHTRELVLTPYIVPYHVRGSVVEILAVIDGRRDGIGKIIESRQA